jgi:LmbE family N-acetylglucosaminyl deacetylase
MTSEKQWAEPDWSSVKRVLAIMAHPDDPDFICGGTALLMARQGIEITYMILTNGDKGNHNPNITRQELIARRKLEQRAACDKSGVRSVIFMNEADGMLYPAPELRKRVVREIRRIRPDLIIITDPDRYFVGDSYINHPDHRNAGLIAIDAIFPASDNPMFYPDLADEGYPPHKIKQLYVFGHNSPNLRLDISEMIEAKIEAILCHRTQISEPARAKNDWLHYWGETQEDGTKRYYERFLGMKF